MRTLGAPPALVLVLVLLLVACQPTESPGPSPSAPGSVAPTEAAPSVPASAAAACEPPVVCHGPLTPGDYLSEGTGAHIAFTLEGDEWSGLPETPGVGFGLHHADLPRVAISALAFVGAVFTDACNPDVGTSAIGTTPAEFVAMLAGRPGISAEVAIDVEVGGRPGLQVDLATEIDDACAASGGEIFVWPLPAAGPFDLYDNQRARIIAVDAGSATVILVAEAQMADVATTGTGEDEYAAFLEVFTELLETMTIIPLE